MKSLANFFLKEVKGRYINPIKYSHLKIEIDCKSRWYGNQYGGFFLNPSLINENAVVYSFGIGEDISFDKEIIDTHKCHVYGFDPTPKSINWCKKQDLPECFHFHDFGISQETGKTHFHLPNNKKHVSGSIIQHNNVSEENFVEVEMKSFKDILKMYNHDQIDVLKMDIEGSEYDVIEDVLKSGILIHQMAIEFHERFFKNGKDKSIQLVDLMKRYGFVIFAISKSFEEISFVRVDALKQITA